MDSKIIIKISEESGFDFEELRHEAEPLPLSGSWQDSYHDGSCGCSRHRFKVYVEEDSGRLTKLPEVVGDRWTTNYAHEGGHNHEAACSLGQAIIDQNLTPVAIYVAYKGSDSWTGQADSAECSLTRYPWSPPDLVKIRRRLEDLLRKTSDKSQIIQLAGLAGVKLD